ncbi:MAG: Uma2 family endonuclease [Actinomycetota bacterium]|nr:Uma2 family endonuclease [Actinomycetota bacterium]
MGTVTTLPRSRPLGRADLDVMPDDGHRYELIDGALIVTPAPSTAHQTVVLELAVLLRERCPGHLKVLVAPFDVVLTDDTIMQPDLLVARRRDLTERDLPAAPVLAIEVLSPSTRRIDLTLKRSRFEAAGCLHYWVVDPDQPAITAWQLQGAAYVEAAQVTGGETLSVQEPFTMDVVPAQLSRP